MPTFFEGLPMSLLECMGYGVVPIITPVGSIPTVITDQYNGLFINVKDAESIVEAVCFLHTHREKLEQMSKSSCNYIFKHFDPQTYINCLNTIYSNC